MSDMYTETLLIANKQMATTIDQLRKKISELEKELGKSHSALNLALNPRTPSDILLAVKYLEGLEVTR